MPTPVPTRSIAQNEQNAGWIALSDELYL